MTIELTNDFQKAGAFKFLPEFEITFETYPNRDVSKIRYIRLGFWTHSIWFEQ